MVGLVAASVLLLGCGDDDQTIATGSGDPDEPVGAPPGGPDPDPAGPGGGIEEITVEPGIAENARARPFERAEIRPDEGAVEIFFTSGVRECNVLDRVDVERPDANTVEVTLYEGGRPGAEACIDIGVSFFTVVEVDDIAPDTKVIDGTDGQAKSS
ncbi:MAG: hypothetical protein ACRD29_13020 [Acidimicrobiales bacterium]